MEFEWLDTPFDLKDSGLTEKEVEEAFEDPFSIRLLPEFEDSARDARYFCLGKSLANRGLFGVFWTNGKIYRIIFVRDMTDTELNFYERKNAEMQ